MPERHRRGWASRRAAGRPGEVAAATAPLRYGGGGHQSRPCGLRPREAVPRPRASAARPHPATASGLLIPGSGLLVPGECG